MLYRPVPHHQLDAIHALLANWNAEADRFRQAATAARRGETPGSLIIAAVEEAHDGLLKVLDDIDNALAEMPPGSGAFTSLLRAQNLALALLESVGHSHDVLDDYIVAPEIQPVRIAHERRSAL